MAQTRVQQVRGFGLKENLPTEIVEGQLLYASDTVEEFLDHDGVRTLMNPPGDWFETDVSSPDYIANKPDIEAMLREIELDRKELMDTHLYGVHWDKTSSRMTRLFDSASITTDTTNFVYFGSVNENYNNPFDDIYPWSLCRQCNVDLAAYRSQVAGDDIRDAVVAWYGDPDFALDGSNGFVGRYTPEFWHYGYEDSTGKFVLVSDKEIPGFIHHKPSIRSHGFAVDDGDGGVTSNDGQPLVNVALSSIHAKAKAGGMTLEDIYELDANVALYMVEFADTDAQAKLGDGCSDCYIQPDFTITNPYDDVDELLLSASMLPYAIPGALLDFGTSIGGYTERRTVVSSEAYNSTYCKVKFTPSISQSANMYASIHGKNNADSIGNKSGFVGVNGKNNAWYRGMILYGNRYRYALGAYRQTGTNHLWLCDPLTCDNYDTLDTSVHIDTGITILTPSSNSWQSVGDYTIPEDKLSSFGPITAAASVTGDSQYCVILSTANTIAILGASASNGSVGGVLCAGWDFSASGSRWDRAGSLLLKSK